MTSLPTPLASAAGTFLIGGELPVVRLGYGSMQLTGRNALGPPRDPDAARRVLRRAVELGVTLIDTADAYGPDVAENLIAEALHPYPDDLVIATKGGFVRGDRGQWRTDGRPTHLRDALEGSLHRLRLDAIDLYQLHRIDSAVPLDDQIGTLSELRDEGKIRYIGLSEVTVTQVRRASVITPIATVQNLYNLAQRDADDLVDYAAEHSIGFIPWFPLATGQLTEPTGPMGAIARRSGASASQIALAWLLQRSPTMIPIPGTSSVQHLEENLGSAQVQLEPSEIRLLNGRAR